MSVDLLYESLRGAGIDPGNSANVLDLAAVGATFLLWRSSPVEDWHYRIVQSEMMRANAATTRAVRECVLSHLSPWTTSAEDGQDARAARRVFSAVGQVVADAQRRLPDSRTLAAWASSQEELPAFEQHVRRRVRRWTLLAGQEGLVSVLVLVLLALVGGASCRQWWLMPWWPDRVACLSSAVVSRPAGTILRSLRRSARSARRRTRAGSAGSKRGCWPARIPSPRLVPPTACGPV